MLLKILMVDVRFEYYLQFWQATTLTRSPSSSCLDMRMLSVAQAEANQTVVLGCFESKHKQSSTVLTGDMVLYPVA